MKFLQFLNEGANVFFTVSKGKTAKDAFWTAVEQARAGRTEGYSGTIAEKGSFIEIPLPKGKNPQKFANELINKDDPRVDDKWGPAGCIQIKKGEYLFFGWASS